MTKKEIAKKKTPAQAQQNQQYDLFATFFGDAAELSNTIELWDAIPKYAVSVRSQNAMRSSENRLPVHEYRFVYATSHSGHYYPIKQQKKKRSTECSMWLLSDILPNQQAKGFFA